MDTLIQLCISIIIPASLFALVAGGFSLILSVTRTLHLAHGVVVLLGGYLYYSGFVLWHANVFVAALIAIIGCVLLGVMVDTLVYQRLRTGRRINTTTTLVASLAVLTIVQNVLLLIYGSQTRVVEPFIMGSLSIGDASLTYSEVFMIILCIVLVFVVWLFWQYSRFGQAARAVADNPEVSEIIGINPKHIRLATICLGSALAGVAGILFAIEYGMQPNLATGLTIRAFSRSVVGGVGSIPGALLGSVVIEAAEVFGGFYWVTAYKEVISFLIVFLFLLYRPKGILGNK